MDELKYLTPLGVGGLLAGVIFYFHIQYVKAVALQYVAAAARDHEIQERLIALVTVSTAATEKASGAYQDVAAAIHELAKTIRESDREHRENIMRLVMARPPES